MKTIYPLFLLLISLTVSFAQKPDDVLATATGHTFHLSDLGPATQKWAEDLPAQVKEARGQLFAEMINQRLLEIESRGVNQPVAKLLSAERAKAAPPTEAEIKALYDSKQGQLGDQTLEQLREPIIKYLSQQAEQKKLGELVAGLRAKYKYTAGKDINAVGLSGTDVIATVNGQAITAKEYDDFARFSLFDLRASLGDQILGDLDEVITSALISDEAKASNLETDALIAREITNKMKDFSDEERETLTNAWRKQLYAKYKVQIQYKAPAPIVQNISVDDDPATGPANAPVTVVMFSDFQCSACSATHPVLKKAMEAYTGKIRFVVRDFPLESVHENAWRAALAAGAANTQGKFFEYTEILYTHQDALDDASLKKYAAELGLNAKQFELDFNSEKTAAEVRKDIADGEAYGINGTPTIFINGIRVRNMSISGFHDAIDRALGKQ